MYYAHKRSWNILPCVNALLLPDDAQRTRVFSKELVQHWWKRWGDSIINSAETEYMNDDAGICKRCTFSLVFFNDGIMSFFRETEL